MKTFSLLLGIAAATEVVIVWKKESHEDFLDIDHTANFAHWKDYFNKDYVTLEEEANRFLIFMDNWKYINEHNSGESNYKLGLNQFADMTRQEFRDYIHGGSDSCLMHKEDWVPVTDEASDIDAPTSIDWTDYNGKSYVTPVKNQGQCGSCWAFSTTGSIESATAIKTQTTGSSITTLSEQQLVDCSKAEGNMGCNGGLMDNAFKYVEKEGGLCSESEYPYEARDGTCRATTCGTKYDPITGYKDVTADSMTSLMDAVAMGPVSIAIEADQSAFQFYKSGVLDGLCGTRLDHGVLAVGYGATATQEYWKVKNSWGASWGEEGYVLICRNCNKNGKEGECGILMQPSYPTV